MMVPMFSLIPSFALLKLVIMAFLSLPAKTNESEASILGSDVTGSKYPASISSLASSVEMFFNVSVAPSFQ